MNLRYTIIAAIVVHALGALYVWATHSPLRPIVECVEQTPQGWVAHLGWLSSADEALELAPGDKNQFVLDGNDVVDLGQPQTFLEGRSPKYPKTPFRVKFDRSVTWELGSREVTATRETQRCVPPDEQKAVPEMPMAKVVQPPPPKEEEPPPPPKEEEPPPPPKEEPKAEPKKEEAPAPKKATVRKKGQPKKKKREPKKDTPPPKKAEPVPVTLTNVNMTGGVNVQKGESDNFGDPGVKATRSNTNQEQGEKTQDGGGDPGGTGTGPATEKKKPPVIVSPKVVYSPKAKWPSQAPMLGRVVTVRLSLRVGKDGKVDSVKVVSGAGGAFNSAAVALAKRIKFKPGTRDGKPIALPVPWTVVFQPAQ